MNPGIVGLVGVLFLFIMLFSGIPLGIAFMLVGVVGYAVSFSLDGALGLLSTVPFNTFSEYGFSVIPLFVLMGAIGFYGRLTEGMYSSAYRLLGGMRGGLAMATIFACGVFSAVSGSSVACAATMGKVCLPEMKRYEYDDGFATGCVAAGATMDILIPPSVIMIIYGIIAEQSIGKLYLAGFIPGFIQVLFFMGVVFFLCLWKPKLGPAGQKTSFKEKMVALSQSWSAILLFVLIMGGMYFGVFSVNEAAGVGAFAAFVIVVAQRKLTWKGFVDALKDSFKTTAMIFFIIIGGLMYGYFLSISGVSSSFATFVMSLAVSRYVILAAIVIIYLFLGAIMDEIGMILITVPVFFPVMEQLGFDGIWFGIIVVLVCQLGAILPPVGINVFIIHGVAPHVPMYTIYRGIAPFAAATLILIVIVAIWPEIALILPNSMMRIK